MKREWERAGDHQLESVITLGLSTLNIHVAMKFFLFFYVMHLQTGQSEIIRTCARR